MKENNINKSRKHNIKNNINKSRKAYHITKPPFPIDIVYTWKGENKSKNVRLSYNYELKYSLRSIFLNAPWVNKVFILMNKKDTPSWIKNNDKIVIIDHLDTFPSTEYLPNFNSNAIETTIANIEGLSEHYIYFNDDIFLGRKTKYTDFFTPSGKVLIDEYISKKTRNILKDENDNKLNIEFPPGYKEIHKHIPIPQIKSLVLEFNKKYEDYIHWIRMTKKRKNKGFDICEKNNLNAPCQQVHFQIYNYIYLNHKAVLTSHKKNWFMFQILIQNFQKNLKKYYLKNPYSFVLMMLKQNLKRENK